MNDILKNREDQLSDYREIVVPELKEKLRELKSLLKVCEDHHVHLTGKRKFRLQRVSKTVPGAAHIKSRASYYGEPWEIEVDTGKHVYVFVTYGDNAHRREADAA